MNKGLYPLKSFWIHVAMTLSLKKKNLQFLHCWTYLNVWSIFCGLCVREVFKTYAMLWKTTAFVLCRDRTTHIVTNFLVFISGVLKKKNPTPQALHAFTLRQRRGMGSQYVSVYGCPAELHRAVRPLFML